jgi:hypothetical protein
MTKKQLILTIDEDVIAKAKTHIPNISGFVEECLKKHLGMGNGLVNTSKMHELVSTISDCQLELYLMNEREHIEEAKERAAKQEINIAWRRIYTEYRDTKTYDPLKLKHAVEVLGVPKDELTDIVEVCFVFNNRDKVDVTEWEEVYAKYGGEDYDE